MSRGGGGSGEARVHTSILALLGGLGLLGEAGVQPRGGLRVVTAEHKEPARVSEFRRPIRACVFKRKHSHGRMPGNKQSAG